MAGHRCLYCYLPLADAQADYHPACSKKIFGKTVAPQLPYTEDQLHALAAEVIRSQFAITGVQPKLSLDIARASKDMAKPRFTVVGLWGHYILKPPTAAYPHLPEVEDLTMHLATLCKIKTVPHALIRMASGSLAYITQRVDRKRKEKLHMEDLCQLTQRLTEHKYRGSYEQIAKAILQHSLNPGLDVINFYEQVLFSFLTGNADMHLKNFSLLKPTPAGYVLAPAYDLVATQLINPQDNEELALNLNGKKAKLKQQDFVVAMQGAGIAGAAVAHVFEKFGRAISAWQQFISTSFLPATLQAQYSALIDQKARQLGLGA